MAWAKAQRAGAWINLKPISVEKAGHVPLRPPGRRSDEQAKEDDEEGGEDENDFDDELHSHFLKIAFPIEADGQPKGEPDEQR